jgi:micrococcal nuclease
MKIKIALLFILLVSISNASIVKVSRVIDGDTFETSEGEKVRMIGINAPEISDFYGEQAKNYLIRLILNKKIELVSDNFSSDRDRYGRLLRYVKLEGVDINQKMIADGYAFAYLKFNFSKSTSYEAVQVKSRELNQGIWGNSTGNVSNFQETIKDKQGTQNSIPTKYYIIGTLVSSLIIFGIYSAIKK